MQDQQTFTLISVVYQTYPGSSKDQHKHDETIIAWSMVDLKK